MSENISPNISISPHSKPKPKKSVEELYVKLEHADQILTRPDTYIGSVESEETEAWVYDVSLEDDPNIIQNGLILKKINIVPGMIYYNIHIYVYAHISVYKHIIHALF